MISPTLRVLLPASLGLILVYPSFGQTSLRQRIRFDEGWRFASDPLPKRRIGPTLRWEFRPSNVKDKRVTTLPADLHTGEWRVPNPGEDVFRNADHFVWFRTELGAGKPDPNRVLHFDSVDDNAVVFINGQRMGQHSGWNEAFDVRIARAWRPEGPNVAVVLVENESGPGGMGGASYLNSVPPDPKPLAAREGFDDRKWAKVDVPHDYVLDFPFDPSGDNSHGSRPLAPAWYRKSFVLPSSARGKRMWLDFDGVYRNAEVYLNGEKLKRSPSGYIGFRVDIGARARYGRKNVLAVRVDPRRPEGWWYEGGGIYRHVWLNVANPLHVPPTGVFVRSEVLSAQAARVRIQTKVVGPASSFVLSSRVIGPAGKVVKELRTSASRPGEMVQTLSVPAPKLWSPEHPHLYRLETSVIRRGRTVDTQTTTFGIRTVRFDKDKGFFLNGKPLKLKGTCNHQDHAGVGIAVPDSLQEWRIRKLKALGSNAYRCAHHPPAPEVLDACDRLGMLVLAETRHFGDTELTKAPPGTPAKDLGELREMILRDRNHPSIFMWSLANEEPLQGTEEGARIFTAMAKAVWALDPSRPLTAAMNGGWGEGVSLVADVVGMNYGHIYYDRSRRNQPNTPYFASETASTVGTRGVYESSREKGHVTAYDSLKREQIAGAEEAWRPVAERPWLAGAFVWTGFDYRGEPAPYGWPSVSSQFGIMDTCGFPKDNYWYYKAWWGTEPVAHILPHWNWPGKKGMPIDVWVHGNADRYELLLNGRNLGSQPMPRNGHLEWRVPYEPGVLETRGYRNGRVIVRDRVETAGPAVGIRLRSDFRRLKNDGQDAAQIDVEVVDAQGRLVPTAANLIHFTVAGPGKILGVGNGDPSSHEKDKASQRKAFNGRCAVIVASNRTAGKLLIKASSPGIRNAVFTLTVSSD